MLRFVRWLGFYLKVFTEQYFVGWRFAYPTYTKPLKPESGLACLLPLNFPAAHLHPDLSS